MLKQTNGHRQALTLSENTSGNLYTPLSYLGYYPDPGFYLRYNSGTPTLHFDPSEPGQSRGDYKHNTDTSTIPAWEISIPSKLK